MLGLDKTKLCKTSVWQFNCGLNCLTHILADRLEKPESDVVFTTDPAYLGLFQTFGEYYRFDSPITLDELKAVFKQNPSPIDREFIMGPVLRFHLGKVLARATEALWSNDAAAAISDYLNRGKCEDIATPIYNANRAFFEQLKKEYDLSLAQAKSKPITEYERLLAVQSLVLKLKLEQITPEITDAQVLFNRENATKDTYYAQAKEYWFAVGCTNYAKYMGSLEIGEMVHAYQLEYLCKELKIGLEVYTPGSIARAEGDGALMGHTHGMQTVPYYDYHWVMKVYNQGIHWEYQEPNGDVIKTIAHNFYYALAQENQALKSNDAAAAPSPETLNQLTSLLKAIALDDNFKAGNTPRSAAKEADQPDPKPLLLMAQQKQSSEVEDKRPAEFLIKSYDRTYASIMGSSSTVDHDAVHSQTIAKLKARNTTIKPEDEAWLKSYKAAPSINLKASM